MSFIDTVNVRSQVNLLCELKAKRGILYEFGPSLWTIEQKSQVVEMALMRLPMLPVFFQENDHGHCHCVLGNSAVVALFEYVNNEFMLSPTTFGIIDDKLIDVRFSALPSRLQNRIEDVQFDVRVFDYKSPSAMTIGLKTKVKDFYRKSAK